MTVRLVVAAVSIRKFIELSDRQVYLGFELWIQSGRRLGRPWPLNEIGPNGSLRKERRG